MSVQVSAGVDPRGPHGVTELMDHEESPGRRIGCQAVHPDGYAAGRQDTLECRDPTLPCHELRAVFIGVVCRAGGEPHGAIRLEIGRTPDRNPAEHALERFRDTRSRSLPDW